MSRIPIDLCVIIIGVAGLMSGCEQATSGPVTTEMQEDFEHDHKHHHGGGADHEGGVCEGGGWRYSGRDGAARKALWRHGRRVRVVPDVELGHTGEGAADVCWYVPLATIDRGPHASASCWEDHVGSTPARDPDLAAAVRRPEAAGGARSTQPTRSFRKRKPEFNDRRGRRV